MNDGIPETLGPLGLGRWFSSVRRLGQFSGRYEEISLFETGGLLGGFLHEKDTRYSDGITEQARVDLGAIWHHEAAHFYQMIGTTTGQIEQSLEVLTHTLCKSVCAQQRLSAANVVYKSLMLWAQRSLGEGAHDMQALAQPLSRVLNLYAAGVKSWRLLAGSEVVSSAEAARAWGAYCQTYTDAWDTRDYWEKLSEREQRRTLPSAPFGRGGAIGAMQLYEGQARAIEEIHRIAFSGSLDRPWKLGLDRWFSEYSIALEYMLARHKRSIGEVRLGHEWCEFLTRFAALCDMALMTHMEPIHKHAWHSDCVWAHYHPGWRFTLLVEGDAASIGVPWGMDCRDAYRSVAEALFEWIGWPRPWQIASVRQGDPNPAPHVGLRSQAMRLRETEPTVFVVPGALWVGPDKLWTDLEHTLSPPIVYSSETGDLVLSGAPDWHLARGFEPDSYAAWFVRLGVALDLASQLMWRNGPFHVTSDVLPHTSIEQILDQDFQIGALEVRLL